VQDEFGRLSRIYIARKNSEECNVSVAKCPKCSKQSKIPDGFKGGRVKCKACGCAFDCPVGVPPQPADPLIGKTLGDYKIVKMLGQGGMGAVYEAWQQKLDRSVALKVLSRNLGDDEKYIIRFRREARAAARLIHHNVVQVYDVGEQDGIYFFSMEYVQGETLLDRLKAKKVLPPDEAGEYVLQAARGMEFAHRQNIIHRDIKPENLMINTEGIVKIADLGLAKKLSGEEQSVTMAGVAMGTPYYIAPEQASDAASADHRADIYSLGCTFYQFLTGRLPFDGQSSFEIMTKHTSEPVVEPIKINAQIPEVFSDLIMKMMEKDPRKRPQSLVEVINEIESFLGLQRSTRQAVPKSDVQPFSNILHNYTASKGAYPDKLLMILAAVAFVVSLILIIPKATVGLSALAGLVIGISTHLFLGGAVLNSFGYRRLNKKMRTFRIVDWLSVGVGGLVIFVFLLLLGAGAFFTACIAAAICVVVFYAVSRPILLKIKSCLAEIGELFQRWKDAGVTDQNTAKFFYEHGGMMWENICEHFQGRAKILKMLDETAEIRKASRTLYEKTRSVIFDRMDMERLETETVDPAVEETLGDQVSGEGPQATPATAPVAPTVITGVQKSQELQPTVITQAPNSVPQDVEQMQTLSPVINDEEPGKDKGALKMILGAQGRFIVGAILLAVFLAATKEKAGFKAEWMKDYSLAIMAGSLVLSAFMKNVISLLLFTASAVLAFMSLPVFDFEWALWVAIVLAALAIIVAVGGFGRVKRKKVMEE